MGIASDVRAIILAAIPSETVELFHEPPDPAAVTTLYGTGGPQALTDFSGTAHGFRTGQIRVRDPSVRACESRCEALYALFVAIRYYPAYFISIQASTAPFYGYPVDANGNFIGSFNLVITKGS